MAHIAHIARTRGRGMFSGCLVRCSTCSTYSKDPGRVDVQWLVRYGTYSTCSKGPGDWFGGLVPAAHSLPAAPRDS